QHDGPRGRARAPAARPGRPLPVAARGDREPLQRWPRRSRGSRGAARAGGPPARLASLPDPAPPRPPGDQPRRVHSHARGPRGWDQRALAPPAHAALLRRAVRIPRGRVPRRLPRVGTARLVVDLRRPELGPRRSRGDGGSRCVGLVLRRWKLDELPQLITVLRGEMSFVGPRPEVPRYVDMFAETYRELLAVRPGITDPASVAFRDEEALLGRSPNAEELYVHEI